MYLVSVASIEVVKDMLDEIECPVSLSSSNSSDIVLQSEAASSKLMMSQSLPCPFSVLNQDGQGQQDTTEDSDANQNNNCVQNFGKEVFDFNWI